MSAASYPTQTLIFDDTFISDANACLFVKDFELNSITYDIAVDSCTFLGTSACDLKTEETVQELCNRCSLSPSKVYSVLRPLGYVSPPSKTTKIVSSACTYKQYRKLAKLSIKRSRCRTDLKIPKKRRNVCFLFTKRLRY